MKWKKSKIRGERPKLHHQKKVIFTLRRGIGWNWISYMNGNNIIISLDSIYLDLMLSNWPKLWVGHFGRKKNKKHILKITALNPKAPNKKSQLQSSWLWILRPFFFIDFCPTKPPNKKHTPQFASIFTKGKNKIYFSKKPFEPWSQDQLQRPCGFRFCGLKTPWEMIRKKFSKLRSIFAPINQVWMMFFWCQFWVVDGSCVVPRFFDLSFCLDQNQLSSLGTGRFFWRLHEHMMWREAWILSN